MRISKLWLRLCTIDYLRNLIQQGLFDTIKNRSLGTSTGVALKIIGEAMTNPEKPIKMVEYGYDIYVQNQYLRDTIENLIRKMELDYFESNRTSNTLTYKPFVDVEVEIIIKCKEEI